MKDDENYLAMKYAPPAAGDLYSPLRGGYNLPDLDRQPHFEIPT